MTRAERIEAAAKALVEYGGAPNWNSYRHDVWAAKFSDLWDALVLPPDPVPRRLTVEDMNDFQREFDCAFWTTAQMLNFLNARIFGETK